MAAAMTITIIAGMSQLGVEVLFWVWLLEVWLGWVVAVGPLVGEVESLGAVVLLGDGVADVVGLGVICGAVPERIGPAT